MLKLFGIALVSFSVWLGGNRVSKMVKKKMSLEDALLNLVEYIKSMICAGSFALCDIFASFRDGRIEIARFYEILHSKECNSLTLALDKLSLTDCDGELLFCLRNFSENIGNCYSSQEAVLLCDKCTSQMKNRLSLIRESDKKREQMYKKLSFILACGIFVLCL